MLVAIDDTMDSRGSHFGVLSLAWVITVACACMLFANGRFNALSTRLTGEVFCYEVRPGDSIASVGSRYGIEASEVAAANGLSARERLAPGRTLHLDNRHVVPMVDDDVSLVINVPQRMLFVVDRNVEPASYPVALGRRDWPTPVGDFEVTSKEEDPTWDVPESIQEEMRREGRPVVRKVAPGPANPLGSFWLGLSLGSVGIHGTNAPSSIYRHTTHGCIRLHPDDIADLFPRVTVGMKGRIVYEPVLLGRTGAGIFLEAHPDVYRRTKADPVSIVRQIALAAGIAGEIDWGEVARVLHGRAGIARQVELAEE